MVVFFSVLFLGVGFFFSCLIYTHYLQLGLSCLVSDTLEIMTTDVSSCLHSSIFSAVFLENVFQNLSKQQSDLERSSAKLAFVEGKKKLKMKNQPTLEPLHF